MNTTISKLLEDALELPDTDRAELAAELIARLDPSFEEDSRKAWEAEIGRRVMELDSGRVACLPWSEARRIVTGRLDEPTGR